MKTILDKNGAVVRNLTDGDTYVAKDGETMRVTLTLMDSQPPAGTPFMDSYDSRSGAPLTDAQIDARRKMWDAQKQKLSNAWKNPAAFEVPAAQIITQVAPAPTIDASYDRYEQRLSNAWKASA